MKKIVFLILPLYLLSGNLSTILTDTLHNKLVESSSYGVASSINEYNSIKAQYKPQINIGSTYTKTNEETASVADSSIVSYAKIDYVLYDGGAKNNRYKALKSNIKASKENVMALKNNLALEVVQLYYNYLSLDASKKAKVQEIKTLQAQKTRLENFLRAGTTTQDEVEKIISRVQSAKVVLSQIQLDMETILHNLTYLANKQHKIEDGSCIILKKNMKNENRPDIKVLEYETQVLKENAKVSMSSNYPIVTLDNTFYNYDMNYDNSAYDSLPDTQNVFKLNVNWKIFDFGATDDIFKSNYKKYLSSKSNLEYEKIKANVDLKLAIKAYKIAKLQIKSASLALDAANATYNSIESKYKNGLVENVTYLEALSEKSAAISILEKAKNDLEIKKAMIVYYSGLNVWENVQ